MAFVTCLICLCLCNSITETIIIRPNTTKSCFIDFRSYLFRPILGYLQVLDKYMGGRYIVVFMWVQKLKLLNC
jgi:hypothetical protein